MTHTEGDRVTIDREIVRGAGTSGVYRGIVGCFVDDYGYPVCATLGVELDGDPGVVHAMRETAVHFEADYTPEKG